MLKIKFIGNSDFDFKNDNIYTLVKFEETPMGVKTYITNNYKKIKYIYYTSLNAFNNNWEVIE